MIKPTEDLKDVLGILTEECAELIQAASKIDRFGLDGKHPLRKENNTEEFIQELGDVCAIIAILVLKYGDKFPQENVSKAILKKIAKVKKYYKHLEDFNIEELIP